MTGGHEIAEELERAWKGDAEGEAFHGPSLRRVLAGITAEVAARRPIPTAHSIHEILEHMATWRALFLNRLAAPAAPAPADDGWVRVERADPAAWAALLLRARDQEDHILAALRASPSAPDARARAYLRFLLHHDLHHGGQIALLKSAARA